MSSLRSLKATDSRRRVSAKTAVNRAGGTTAEHQSVRVAGTPEFAAAARDG